MEMFTAKELAGENVEEDEMLGPLFEDLKSRREGVRLGPRGTLEWIVDGQTLHLTPQKYPNLAREAALQQGVDPAVLGLPASPTAAPAAIPEPQINDPLLRNDPTFGERLGQIGGEITDVVSRNVVEPVANRLRQSVVNKALFEYNKGGQISRESLQSLVDIPPQQLRQLGLPEPVVALIERARAPSGGGTTTDTAGAGRGEAIPGV
jgi:hypothetical protein